MVFSRSHPNNSAGKKIAKCHQRTVTSECPKAKNTAVIGRLQPTSTPSTSARRARISGIVEIRLWVLSWGDEVEVLEPKELRDEVAEILGRAAAQYGARRGRAT